MLPYSREVSRSINKGKPALVSAANSDIGRKLSEGMQQFLHGSVTPVLGTASTQSQEVGGLRRLMHWRRTPKVPELERTTP
jgi:hypothetical protein